MRGGQLYVPSERKGQPCSGEHKNVDMDIDGCSCPRSASGSLMAKHDVPVAVTTEDAGLTVTPGLLVGIAGTSRARHASLRRRLTGRSRRRRGRNSENRHPNHQVPLQAGAARSGSPRIARWRSLEAAHPSARMRTQADARRVAGRSCFVELASVSRSGLRTEVFQSLPPEVACCRQARHRPPDRLQKAGFQHKLRPATSCL